MSQQVLYRLGPSDNIQAPPKSCGSILNGRYNMSQQDYHSVHECPSDPNIRAMTQNGKQIYDNQYLYFPIKFEQARDWLNVAHMWT